MQYSTINIPQGMKLKQDGITLKHYGDHGILPILVKTILHIILYGIGRFQVSIDSFVIIFI